MLGFALQLFFQHVFLRNLKKKIELFQLVISDCLKQTTVKEKRVVAVGSCLKNTLMNDKIKVTMGESTYVNKTISLIIVYISN